MDIGRELHDALDGEHFSGQELLAQAMARLESSRPATGQRWAPLVAAILVVALVVTLVVIRLGQANLNLTDNGPSLPVDSTVTGETTYQFISAEVGWLTVSDGTSASIAKTIDGGRSWHSQLNISGAFSIHPPHVQFFDSGTGVVFALSGSTPMVWRTTDGGAHWQTQFIPTVGSEALISGNFLDGQHGWVLTSAGSGPVGTPGPAFVYRTTDGGVHWSRTATLDSEADIAWLGISFASSATGFVTSSAGFRTGHSWTAPLPIFVTHDAGVTWTKLELKAPPAGAFIEALISFAGSAGILTVEDNRVDQCPAQNGSSCYSEIPAGRYLYSTTDGGQHWSDPRPIEHGYVDMIDPQHWVLVTTTSISMSADGGATWSPPQALAIPAQWFATQAQFIDPQHGWVTLSDNSEGDFPGAGVYGPSGKTALIHTDDGGSTWQAVGLPSHSGPSSPSP